MSYKSSDSIGLLTQNGNNCDSSLDPDFPFNEELFSGHQSPPYWISEFGFRSRDQFDGEPIGENLEAEQTYHSSFGYLLNGLDSASCLSNFHDTYGNKDDCRMENTHDIGHDEDQFEDYPGSINLDYESAWECLKSWFGHEDEQSKQELKPKYDCKSDDMALLDSILGHWPCLYQVDEGTCGHQ